MFAGSTLVVGCAADLSELTAALRKHGLRLSDADIRLLADDADEDGNQEIDMEEFATLIEKAGALDLFNEFGACSCSVAADRHATGAYLRSTPSLT